MRLRQWHADEKIFQNKKFDSDALRIPWDEAIDVSEHKSGVNWEELLRKKSGDSQAK
jgi:hypothetical protein